MLGTIGVGTETVMTAVVLTEHFTPYDWTWPQSFLFGAIAATTDPVAAVLLLEQVSRCNRHCDISCRLHLLSPYMMSLPIMLDDIEC